MEKFSKEIDFSEGYILAVDKPYEWTSSDVVRKIRILLNKLGYKKIKVGHAGTLDPLATGLLLICIGKATKRAESLQNEQKEYIADIRLGATTPSYDLEHPIDATYPISHITQKIIEETLAGFIGEQEQLPPIYSAKSIDGKRAYEYARAGKEIELRPSLISYYELFLEKCNLPDITVRIKCSKGTYIRSFARDLGEKLHSGGHLTALRRTQSGIYRVEDAYTIKEIENILHNIK